MWCGSVTLRVKGKEVPRDVTSVMSRITQDEVKSGVNLRKQRRNKERKIVERETMKERQNIKIKKRKGKV